MNLRRAATLLMVLIFVLPASAQEEHPLIELLQYVPATSQAESTLIFYADYVTAIETRLGTPLVTSASDAVELLEDHRNDFSQYMNALPVTSLNAMQYLRELVNTPAVMGFDFFAIEQSITFGNPPTDGAILTGEFDPYRVMSAHQARGYELAPAETDDVMLLCYEGDCESGLTVNVDDRNLANIFGGDLGRNEPIATVNERVILNSAAVDTITEMIAVAGGQAPSLAQSDAYRALAAVMTAQGDLRQAVFIPAAEIGATPIDPMTMAGDIDDAIAEMTERLNAQGELPAAALAAFAETADTESETQRAHVLLAYANQSDAETAASVIINRLNDDSMTSQMTRQPYRDILQQFGGTLLEPEVVEDAENGYFVTVITVEAPLTTAESMTQDGRLIQSGLEFRQLLNMLYMRDLVWLASEVALP